ncbi:MAG: rhamnan synthesis F family protein [Microbacterium sp.]
MAVQADAATAVDPVESTDRRLVIYAVTHVRGGPEAHVVLGLEALRSRATRIVVVTLAGVAAGDAEHYGPFADEVVISRALTFDPIIYADVIAERADIDEYDEVVLTGDSWFGPVSDIGPVLDRMASQPAAVWAMVQNSGDQLEAFPDAGFTGSILPWTWTSVRREVLSRSVWKEYWGRRSSGGKPGEEVEFLRHMSRSADVAYAFAAVDYPSEHPSIFTPSLLLDDGCPFLLRELFLLYPPYLDRFAVIGREVLADLSERGFPLEPVLSNLARTVQPKALYAIAGMLEVLADEDVSYDAARPFRLAAVVHVTDAEPVAQILDRLSFLPSPYDLFVTTTDGKRAERLQRLLDKRADPLRQSVDVRVTPANRGRDMSDFFVGCRDVLLSGRYDLVLKLHARRIRRKSDNQRRYFRRYQYENLLNTPGYAANLLALFQREPGLGVVFPPMMHIGYSLMGHAWGGLRDASQAVARDLGIDVPFDAVSPLAPFGGMWIGRPEALAPLLQKRWLFRDYNKRSGKQYLDLAKVQERLIAYAAASRGYHARTVLTHEHASISHTMLESKTDNLLSTTRGWPAEQIKLMQRSGDVGHLGVVALLRMYIRLNHPGLARLTMPLFELALRAVVVLTYARRGVHIFASVLRGRTPESWR